MITGRINVSDIPKDKLYEGKKGLYLNFVMIPTPNSQYSDYMIKMDQTKEERDSGDDGVILGNAKDFKLTAAAQPQQSSSSDKDDLPF